MHESLRIAQRSFAPRVAAELGGPLTALSVDALQVNVGARCNLSCKHCHMEAGPSRAEQMSAGVADAVLAALDSSGIRLLDITGGAPEMNPNFRRLVIGARSMGRRVICRTNLCIFFEPGHAETPEFLASNDVNVVASLPYYIGPDVDRVRGDGTFDRSVHALRRLNALGYAGEGGPSLDLVYNPRGAFFAPSQAALEVEYRRELRARHGIEFTRLFTFTNMPIGRFASFLRASGQWDAYMLKLRDAFNPCTLGGIMCRRLVSVGHDGALYDCDFNLALGMPIGGARALNIMDGLDTDALASRPIEVGEHCYACTAGSGST